jgi:hypothetical protein
MLFVELRPRCASSLSQSFLPGFSCVQRISTLERLLLSKGVFFSPLRFSGVKNAHL